MKTFKKVLASTLAAAMVVTALPVTPANAAAAPKLSTTKAAVYVGQSKTIKVTTPKTWKSVKVKATTSKKSVATVKASTKKVTVKAIKAGTAKVTVKVTGKKGKKAVKKTLKATIKVNNPALTLKAADVVAVGATEQITATVKPAGTKVTYTTSDAAIATVDEKGVVTGVKDGEVTITAKAGKTTKTVKMTVKKYVVKSVKQTKADTFEAVVLGKTSDIKASDITVSNKTTNSVYAVKSVAVDEKDATKVTITTFAEFTDGATYVVTVAGTAVEVVASDGVVTDVTVSPIQIPANTDGTEIKAQTVDKHGVILKDFTTESKPNNVDFALTTTQGYVNGTKIVLPVVGNKGTAEVTYHTYKYDENAKEVGAITKKVEITAVAEEAATVAGYNYTIAKATNAPDWTKTVTSVSKFALGDNVNAYFHFVDSKKKDITSQYSVVSSNDSVLLLPEKSLATDHFVKMVAVKAGTAYINVLKDGKVVTSLPVTVTETRKLVNITLGTSSLSISNAASGYTTGDVTVKGLDQYGDEIVVDDVVPKVLTNTDAAKKIETSYNAKAGKVTVNVAGVDKGSYVIKLEAVKGSDKVAKTITVNSVATTKTAIDATDLRLEISDSKIDLAIADDADATKAAKKVTAKVAAYDQGVKVGEITGAKFTLNDKTEKINPDTGVVDAVSVSGDMATKNIAAGTYVVKASYETTVDGKKVTKNFSGIFTVVDTQAAATVKVNSKKTTKTAGADILAETCVASYNGKDYTTFSVDPKEVKTNGNYTYIGNATVTVTNGKVSYSVPVAINTTFTK